jgi:hypothetical protein
VRVIDVERKADPFPQVFNADALQELRELQEKVERQLRLNIGKGSGMVENSAPFR